MSDNLSSVKTVSLVESMNEYRGYLTSRLRDQELKDRLRRHKNVSKQSIIVDKQAELSHVVYVMETVKVCGGVKVILEHARYLSKLGIRVTLVVHYPPPTWFPVEADYIQVPLGIELAKGIPQCDLIIANYYKHLHSCVETGIAPVVYFEQGDHHLLEFEKLTPEMKEFVFNQFQLPPFILTVSNQAAIYIQSNFGRDSEVIHIAVDKLVFNNQVSAFQWHKPYILMMGLEESFKSVEDVAEAHNLVRAQDIDIDLIWITPKPPNKSFSNVSKVLINPKQEEIASLYKGAAVYVSASQYETFSLPVLEAMSCGCPVVTTRNAGVLEYAESDINSMLANINEPEDLASKIITLLTDDKLMTEIKKKGLETARKFSWENSIQRIMDYYQSCSQNKVVPKSSVNDWDITLNKRDLLNPEEYATLMTLILNSERDIIYLPYINNISDIQIARWEIAATRRVRANNDFDKFLIYALGKNQPSDLYMDAYQKMMEGAYLDAISILENQYNAEKSSTVKAIYIKWIVICLIRTNNYIKSRKFILDSLQKYEGFSDIYHLYNYTNLIEFNVIDHKTESLARLIGNGVLYPEFIIKIQDRSRG